MTPEEIKEKLNLGKDLNEVAYWTHNEISALAQHCLDYINHLEEKHDVVKAAHDQLVKMRRHIVLG